MGTEVTAPSDLTLVSTSTSATPRCEGHPHEFNKYYTVQTTQASIAKHDTNLSCFIEDNENQIFSNSLMSKVSTVIPNPFCLRKQSTKPSLSELLDKLTQRVKAHRKKKTRRIRMTSKKYRKSMKRKRFPLIPMDAESQHELLTSTMRCDTTLNETPALSTHAVADTDRMEVMTTDSEMSPYGLSEVVNETVASVVIPSELAIRSHDHFNLELEHELIETEDSVKSEDNKANPEFCVHFFLFLSIMLTNIYDIARIFNCTCYYDMHHFTHRSRRIVCGNVKYVAHSFFIDHNRFNTFNNWNWKAFFSAVCSWSFESALAFGRVHNDRLHDTSRYSGLLFLWWRDAYS